MANISLQNPSLQAVDLDTKDHPVSSQTKTAEIDGVSLACAFNISLALSLSRLLFFLGLMCSSALLYVF